MKSVSRFAMVATLGAVLVGCGKPVEVPGVKNKFTYEMQK